MLYRVPSDSAIDAVAEVKFGSTALRWLGSIAASKLRLQVNLTGIVPHLGLAGFASPTSERETIRVVRFEE
jgi:hypothetical protein